MSYFNKLMNMKKILMFAAAALLMASCAKKAENVAEYTEPVKLADYLFEMSYTDYVADYSHALDIDFAACSAVRNGNFYGRNLDFYYNNMSEVVVHVAAKEGRFASVGVCPYLAEGDSLSEEMARILPNYTYDGINEMGVCCNVNVVPKQDVAPVTGTNPGKEELAAVCVVRMILDRAATANEALKLLDEYNVSGSMGDFNFHWMVNDEKESYIIEIIDNKVVAWCNFGQIMTNYYATLDSLTPHACGVERYKILEENYAMGATMDGMDSLMRMVRYTRAYERETVPFWYSEFYGDDHGHDLNLYSDTTEFADKLERIEELYEHMQRGNGMWITTHCSIYDIAARKFRLYVQENYEQRFEFGI